ncbi:MAG TPA: Rpn family recombination-promoting nuclease/putative transposase [Thermoanaerobaculia bacterium]|nr:Rpn family recombination-promoting nuclease/putative transposase [Thermoanaerobaculia bacterium]
MADHDGGYKLLFSHARMVEDLIRGFVREDWVEELDFSSLEKLPTSFINDKRGEHREGDVLWRLRWGKGPWLYVYILLELQSTVDRYMAVRMLTYVGLLYQDLIRRKLVNADGRLPPILPVVLYNGDTPWRATRDVASLVEDGPAGLERYRPRLEYFLLDEGQLGKSDLEPLQNVAAALFRLERSREPRDLEPVLKALLEWLRQPEHRELQRSLASWLRNVLLRARMPNVEIPEMADLLEVNTMLADRVVEWTREWERGGVEKTLTKVRAVLVRHIEARFGPLAEGARERLDAIDSAEALAEMIGRVPLARSLDDLGLE